MLSDGIIRSTSRSRRISPALKARTKSARSPILKCAARSIRLIRYRPAAPPAPRNRIRANADNRKASHTSLFERLGPRTVAGEPQGEDEATVLLINTYRTPVSGVFRRKDSGFAVCGENLASVSQVVAGIRHGSSGVGREKMAHHPVARGGGQRVHLGDLLQEVERAPERRRGSGRSERRNCSGGGALIRARGCQY